MYVLINADKMKILAREEYQIAKDKKKYSALLKEVCGRDDCIEKLIS